MKGKNIYIILFYTLCVAMFFFQDCVYIPMGILLVLVGTLFYNRKYFKESNKLALCDYLYALAFLCNFGWISYLSLIHISEPTRPY